MSYSLNSLKGGYIGGYLGTTIGDIKGETRSLDYGSYALINMHLQEATLCPRGQEVPLDATSTLFNNFLSSHFRRFVLLRVGCAFCMRGRCLFGCFLSWGSSGRRKWLKILVLAEVLFLKHRNSSKPISAGQSTIAGL